MGWGLFWPLGATVIIMMGMRVLEVLWWGPKRIERHFSRQGIRGPPYRFFTGNIREMVGLAAEESTKPMMPPHNILPRVLSFYHHWNNIYGSTFLLWFGTTARLAVSDPNLIREILFSTSDAFDRYESHPLVQRLEGGGLVSLRGDKWARHKKILTPTFHLDNLNLLIPQIGETVVDMVERWGAKSPSGEVEIDVSKWFQIMTEDAVAQTTFGRSYSDGRAVFELQAQQMVFVVETFRKVFVPGYRFLPGKRNASCWKLDREINTTLVRLIDHRKNEDGMPNSDLLGLMIPTMTVAEMVEECKTFCFAGKQTTSNLLTWTTVLLAMHPQWQEQARDEVLRVCGARDVPTRHHIPRLKTMGMIVNETLRLYPPVVAMIRRAKADVELGGYRIPGDTEVLIPIIALHHDTALWGQDAARFNPARFAHGKAQASQHTNAFIPFGLGTRMCIGQNLAILEAKLTVAIILQRFSFHLAPSYIHAPTVLMLLYPQYGAPVVFSPLSAPTTKTTVTTHISNQC